MVNFMPESGQNVEENQSYETVYGYGYKNFEPKISKDQKIF